MTTFPIELLPQAEASRRPVVDEVGRVALEAALQPEASDPEVLPDEMFFGHKDGDAAANHAREVIAAIHVQNEADRTAAADARFSRQAA